MIASSLTESRNRAEDLLVVNLIAVGHRLSNSGVRRSREIQTWEWSWLIGSMVTSSKGYCDWGRCKDV